MQYLLAKRPISSPTGLDGLVLRKRRHPTYWGFLFSKLGYAEGVGSISFSEPVATSILRRAWSETGLSSNLSFEIIDGPLTLYSGFVDFSQYSDDTVVVSVGLRDDESRMRLSTNGATTYELPTNNVMKLHGRQLSGAPDLVVSSELAIVQQSFPYSRPIAHSIPISRKSDNSDAVPGTILDISAPKTNTAFYKNDTGTVQQLRLQGSVRVTYSTASGTRSYLQIRQGIGNSSDTRNRIGEVLASSTPTTKDFAIDVPLSVNSGELLWLEWESTSDVLWWNFAYDTSKTVLSLSMNTIITPSNVATLSVYDAFRSLVSLATGGLLSFSSTYFATGEGASLFLTNGANLRGVSKALSVSLQDLFIKFDKILNLELDVTDEGVVLIEPKTDILKRRGKTPIHNVVSFVEVPALDWTFTDISVGYSVWQGESSLSANEVNANRQYTTSLSTITRKTLDLTSDIIVSGTLIEEQRRKRDDQQTAAASKSDNYDTSLFLLCGVLKKSTWENERLEKVDSLKGIVDSSNVYNIRLTPSRNLLRWLPMAAQSGQITLTSSAGNNQATSIYDGLFVDESKAVLSDVVPLIGGSSANLRKATLETPMSMTDFFNLGDEIETSKGTGLLMEAAWRPNDTGLATLIIYY